MQRDISALEKAQSWQSENQPGEDYILPKVAHRYLSNPSGVQKDVMKIIRCATGLETTGKKNTAQRVRNPNLYSLHSFRHTFGSKLVNGIKQPDGSLLCLSPKQVADLLGHSTSEITEMYYVKRDNTRLVGITDGFAF